MLTVKLIRARDENMLQTLASYYRSSLKMCFIVVKTISFSHSLLLLSDDYSTSYS